jgi:hypothetical protein
MKPIVTKDQTMLYAPGVVVSCNPEEADSLGAFQEDALSFDDAWYANIDSKVED